VCVLERDYNSSTTVCNKEKREFLNIQANIHVHKIKTRNFWFHIVRNLEDTSKEAVKKTTTKITQ
jgi:hypothetical protein